MLSPPGPADPLLIATVVSILFLSTLCRATFGFGDAVIAMPLLILVLPPPVAAPLVGLVAITLSVGMLATSWRSVAWRESWRLVVAAVAGAPLGIALLRLAPAAWVRGTLGVLLIGYAAWRWRTSMGAVGRERGGRALPAGWAWAFGLVAGCLGTAYNTNGPPVVVYGTLRRWPPDRFRVTLQSFLLPSGLVIVASHGAAGLWTAQLLRLYLLALPAVAVALVAGELLSRRMEPGRFDRLLDLLVAALGALLLIGALRVS